MQTAIVWRSYLIRGLVLSALLVLPAPPVIAEDSQSAPPLSGVDRRMAEEEKTLQSRFALLPHRPTYLLPITYNADPNAEPFGVDDGELDHTEVKYQISLKVRLAKDLFGKGSSLNFGYTQLSLWQAYNSDNSEPFRDTNYEPEIFASFFTDTPVLGLTNRLISLGYVHQSNGRGLDALSRSWDRLFALFVLDRGDFTLGLKPWLRIGESDQNENIDKYYGYGEVYLLYNLDKHSFAAMVRNNLRTGDNKGGIQLDYSYPINNQVRFYIQGFSGYGEALLDYNHYSNRIGAGFMLSNWL